MIEMLVDSNINIHRMCANTVIMILDVRYPSMNIKWVYCRVLINGSIRHMWLSIDPDNEDDMSVQWKCI